MRFLTMTALAFALTAGSSQMAVAEVLPATDFTLPTYGDQPTGDCAAEKVMPDWMNEGYEIVPQRWRRNLRKKLYTIKRYETIVATGRCTCAEQYPDPEQWRDEIEAFVDRFRDNPRDGIRATGQLTEVSTPLGLQVTKICQGS